jgi:hypothetical protein
VRTHGRTHRARYRNTPPHNTKRMAASLARPSLPVLTWNPLAARRRAWREVDRRLRNVFARPRNRLISGLGRFCPSIGGSSGFCAGCHDALLRKAMDFYSNPPLEAALQPPKLRQAQPILGQIPAARYRHRHPMFRLDVRGSGAKVVGDCDLNEIHLDINIRKVNQSPSGYRIRFAPRKL